MHNNKLIRVNYYELIYLIISNKETNNNEKKDISVFSILAVRSIRETTCDNHWNRLY
jgi:hypothetical protein